MGDFKEFNAEHSLFYESFEKWRKEMLLLGLPQNGVYQLVANKSIGRVLKSDDIGILYIGKGDILSNLSRVGKFVNAINNTESKHDGGSRYQSLHISKLYPLKNSVIKVTLSNDAEGLEQEMLNSYLIQFGELPPLNRKNEIKF